MKELDFLLFATNLTTSWHMLLLEWLMPSSVKHRLCLSLHFHIVPGLMKYFIWIEILSHLERIKNIYPLIKEMLGNRILISSCLKHVGLPSAEVGVSWLKVKRSTSNRKKDPDYINAKSYKSVYDKGVCEQAIKASSIVLSTGTGYLISAIICITSEFTGLWMSCMPPNGKKRVMVAWFEQKVPRPKSTMKHERRPSMPCNWFSMLSSSYFSRTGKFTDYSPSKQF